MRHPNFLPRLTLFLLCGAVLWLAGCSAKGAAQPKLAAPAKVEHGVKEADLATVKLTPQAEQRLQIETVTIEERDWQRTLETNGEIVQPQGHTMTVAAPLAGTLQGSTPGVGQAVRKGQTLFRLTPFLAPERDLRVQLERDLKTASERVDVAKKRQERAEILAQEKAGSLRALEEAQAELGMAEAELNAARERLVRLENSALDSDFSVAVTAPLDGIIQKVNAGAGQATASGAVLVEIANLSTVWVRVPVYVGDLPQVARQQGAQIHNLSEDTGGPVRWARPVQAPPTADPTAATADLYYSLSNPDNSLRPGQRVGVTLALRAEERSLVIPWSAVVHDIQGGTWVYENSAPQTYVRRPVEVRRVSNGQAALGRGPQAGTKIVSVGAAELFGTEFGTGK